MARSVHEAVCLIPDTDELAPAHPAAVRRAVALWPLAVVCRPTSLLRLVVGAFGVTLALITLVRLGWIERWVLEQRW